MSRRSRPDPRKRVRALRDPVARSRRLELALPDPARAKEMSRLLNDRAIARGTLHIPHPYRLSDARAYYRRWARNRRTGSVLSLQIVRRSDRALIGGAGLSDISPEHLRAEIGYWLGRPFRHRGYAREAVELLCRLAYRKLGLMRIEAGVFPGNITSVRVLRATGFRKEGQMRQSVRKAGVFCDVLLYARLRGDRPPPSAPAGPRGAARRGSPAAPTR